MNVERSPMDWSVKTLPDCGVGWAGHRELIARPAGR